MKTLDEITQQTRRYLRDLMERLEKAKRTIHKKTHALLPKYLQGITTLDAKALALEHAAHTLDAMIEKAPTQQRSMLQLQLTTLRGLIRRSKQCLESRIQQLKDLRTISASMLKTGRHIRRIAVRAPAKGCIQREFLLVGHVVEDHRLEGLRLLRRACLGAEKELEACGMLVTAVVSAIDMVGDLRELGGVWRRCFNLASGSWLLKW